MCGKIMIPMYRQWLHGLYGLYGPCCMLSPERPLNLITHSLSSPRGRITELTSDITVPSRLTHEHLQNPKLHSYPSMHPLKDQRKPKQNSHTVKNTRKVVNTHLTYQTLGINLMVWEHTLTIYIFSWSHFHKSDSKHGSVTHASAQSNDTWPVTSQTPLGSCLLTDIFYQPTEWVACVKVNYRIEYYLGKMSWDSIRNVALSWNTLFYIEIAMFAFRSSSCIKMIW